MTWLLAQPDAARLLAAGVVVLGLALAWTWKTPARWRTVAGLGAALLGAFAFMVTLPALWGLS